MVCGKNIGSNDLIMCVPEYFRFMRSCVHESNAEEPGLVKLILFGLVFWWQVFLLLASNVTCYFHDKNTILVQNMAATLLIGDDGKGTGGNKITDLLNVYRSYGIVENEAEVTRARALI